MPPDKPSPFIDIFGALRRGFAPFRSEEMVGYHTAQFAQDGEEEFYSKYGLSMWGGVISGLGPRQGNVQEAFAETQGKKMLEAYHSKRKRERWGR